MFFFFFCFDFCDTETGINAEIIWSDPHQMFSPLLGLSWSPWELTHHTHTHPPSIAAGIVDWQRGAGGAGLVQTPSRRSLARASAICHQLQHLQIQGALDAPCHCGPLRISAGGRVGREAAPRTLITSSSLIIVVRLLVFCNSSSPVTGLFFRLFSHEMAHPRPPATVQFQYICKMQSEQNKGNCG